jgi:O-antigen/teichoic acid export membrane protein/GT2 family glycosyltransferase
VAATLVARAVFGVTTIATLAALARFLAKEDFGLVFSVTAITSVLGSLRNFGLGTATLQRAEITDRQVSGLFWMNVALSVVVSLFTVALGPLIVWFYGGDDRLLAIVVAYAAIGTLTGFSVQHEGLLRRQMEFGRLALVDVVPHVVGAIAAVGAALCGAGYWALVVQTATSTVIRTASIWIACDWRPTWPARGAAIAPLLTFGRNLTATHLIQDIASSIDRVLLARFVDGAATGLYGNATRLLSLPSRNISQPLSAVAVAALSRLQDDPDRFRSYYRKALLLLTTLGMPVAALAFVAAEPAIVTVLGPQWADGASIFRILAPAAFISTLAPATSWGYIALGQTDRQARWATAASLARLLALAIGVQWGLIGIAMASTLSAWAERIIGIPVGLRNSPLSLEDIGRAVWRPAAASILAATAVTAGNASILPAGSHLHALLVDCAIFAVVYSAAWLLLPGGTVAAVAVTRLGRELRSDASAPEESHRMPASSPRVDMPLSAADGERPYVSVIIPVYNNASGLGLCLAALAPQTYPATRFEVIVVDNGSTDDVADVVARFPQVRLISEARPGSYAARNRGLSVATGDIIAFTDSDCIPDVGWIEGGVTALCQAEGCGLLGGAITFTYRSPEGPSTPELCDSVFDLDQQRFLALGKFACTANVFTWARVIQDVGPFDAAMKSVGDRDFGNRVAAGGYALAYTRDARVQHPARGTVRELVHKRRRVAGGHHERARKLGMPLLRLVVAMIRVLIRNPFWGLMRIQQKARHATLAAKLKVAGLYVMLSYAQAFERVRLQFGGEARR